MPTCKHCKEYFYADIALGMHILARNRRKPRQCPTTDEMRAEGYALYQGGWLTTEAQWNGITGQKPTESER